MQLPPPTMLHQRINFMELGQSTRLIRNYSICIALDLSFSLEGQTETPRLSFLLTSIIYSTFIRPDVMDFLPLILKAPEMYQCSSNIIQISCGMYILNRLNRQDPTRYLISLKKDVQRLRNPDLPKKYVQTAEVKSLY